MPTAAEVEDANDFLIDIEDGLRTKWSKLARQKFSQNKKGQGFEVAALEFIAAYLGKGLEFHNRVALLDRKLTLLKTLSKGKNEWDLVATFATAVPRFGLQVGNLEYVPLDAAFFVAEVKKTLTNPSLKDDLGKLALLRGLVDGKRFAVSTPAPYQETDLLRLLLYYEKSIQPKRLWDTLGRNLESWDMLLVLKNGILFVNKRIKAAAELAPGESKIAFVMEFPITQLLLFLTFALPAPSKVVTTSPWGNLLRQAQGLDPD